MPRKRFIRDREEKIKLIFETFAALVNEHGYDRLSTNHIAEVAGISIGTVYHYFPRGKHEIASRYIDHVTDELFDPGMFGGLKERDLCGFFDGLVRRYLVVHRENLEIHRAIDQAILADSEVYRRNREATEANMSRVVSELRGMGLYGDMPEASVLGGFVLLFNVLEGLVHRHLFVYPLCETEEELVAFLSNLLEFVSRESGVFGVSSTLGSRT